MPTHNSQQTNRSFDMEINYSEWVEPLLAAGAAGDDRAARMYDICAWLAAGGDVDAATKATIDNYIEWVQEKGNV